RLFPRARACLMPQVEVRPEEHQEQRGLGGDEEHHALRAEALFLDPVRKRLRIRWKDLVVGQLPHRGRHAMILSGSGQSHAAAVNSPAATASEAIYIDIVSSATNNTVNARASTSGVMVSSGIFATATGRASRMDVVSVRRPRSR